VKEGRFRADLYYRIHVIPIHIPPLRGRREDIEAIADHFLARISCETGEIKRSISPELMAILKSYVWPGNIRELQNVLERAVAMTREDVLLPEHVPEHLLPSVSRMHGIVAPGTLAHAKAEAERKTIMAALEMTKGNKSRAATLLGIHRVKLYEKMKRHGITYEPKMVHITN